MNYYEGKKGWVEVITGPMFAGKTEELIRRVKRMDYAKKNYIIFKPVIDNRYSVDEVVSHNKKKTGAINIQHGSEIKRHLKSTTQAVVIDEVQDFSQVNLILFKEIALKIFCAGDALQMINPSYFSFRYLKNLLFEKDVMSVLELKNNF